MRYLYLSLIATACLGLAHADFPIVTDGEARCVIVLGHDAQPVEQQAAEDLAQCLQQMTDVQVPLVKEGQETTGVPRLLIGPCTLPDAVMQAVTGRDYGGYIIRQVGSDLVLRGPSEYGNANAIYGLLEDTLGCHWFMPGELFQHVPRRSEVIIPALDIAVNPGFRFRFFSGVDEGGPWMFRNRLDRPGNRNAPFLGSMGHILYAIYPPSQYGQEHPEYYPLRNGQRRVNTDDADQTAQPCTSNPQVVQVAIDTISRFFDANPAAHTHSVCINDNNDWCECDACRALDVPVPQFRGRDIYSDRYYTYVNAVARGLAERHPDKFIGLFAYAGVEPVPAGIERLEPNVYVGITQDCSQHFDRAYRQVDHDFITQWQQKAAHVGKYDYYGLGAIIPRYYPHLIAEDIKHSRRVGLEGFHSEAFPLWSQFGPQIYVAARMLYNPDLNCDKLLDEFFTSLYGPAAPAMAALYQTFEEAWMSYRRPGRWFEGIGSMSEQISMYRPEHLRAVRSHLRRARKLADSDIIRQRIAYVEKGLRYPLNLIEGWQAAERLQQMNLTGSQSEQAVRLIRQITRCLNAAPRLWQQSIMEDPYSSYWYKAGARPDVIGQWSSFCQSATLGAVTELATAAEVSGGVRDLQTYQNLLTQIRGTEVETILRIHQGDLDDEPNLLVNGSFELTADASSQNPQGPGWSSVDSLPGWSTWMIDSGRGKLYLDSQMVRTGEASAALEGGDTTCYITTVPVEAGRQYAAWVFARAEKVLAPRRTTLEVRWQDNEGKWFGGGINTLVSLRQPNRWERLSSAVTAPEGAAKAVVLLAVYGLSEGERAWFDDAVFVVVPQSRQPDQ